MLAGIYSDVRRLRTAIERDQLRMQYQPKADMRTGRIVGVEALVRWHSPRKGVISPINFIPAAERSLRTLEALTHWTIDTALRQARAWHLDGHDLTMAINISPRSVLEDGLVETVSTLMSTWQVAPSLVQLELTETALFGVGDPERVGTRLRQLSDMGITISLDDFGTGYSSLARLRDLPIDKVKIDKSFVTHMDQRADDALIVRSVISLAKNLGLRVVAEGIETEPVWRRLSELGCDVAQGHYLSPPLPPVELITWVRQWEELYAEAHRMAEELLERRDGPDNRRSGRGDRREEDTRRRFTRDGERVP
jgi:EAL domain-containing protein (putative c-di-GMP-specific phosphodiesterase class I)